MNLQTLNDIFFEVVERGDRVVMMNRQAGHWTSISAQQFYRSVVGIGRGLQEWRIGKGDRVAILSENRPEWAMADFAALLIGAVAVPIYPTLTAEQTCQILGDSGARAAFVSSEVQLNKVLSIRNQTSLERLVTMDAVANPQAIPCEALQNRGPAARDGEFEAIAKTIRGSDTATIIYTSGTTGVPKGVVLTHGNMASNLNCSLLGFDFGSGDLSISFLPLSHVTARHLDYAMLHHGSVLAYVPHPDQLTQALVELRPTIFVAVPRVYEKIHAQVEVKARGFPKAWLYRWALSAGRAHRAEILAGRTPTAMTWKLARRIVSDRVRAGMGNRVRIFISGGAPLGRELAAWYADIGIRIHEGYGLTETSPVIALNAPRAHKLGTVGKPLANVEVRIADDGEVLVRGPSIFEKYWNRPEETRNAFLDGWFKTGDIGNVDADGFLSITDRKKDLIKTSGGKFIAPQPIENSLKHNPLIGEAIVVGEKRKFAAVLIVPNFALLENWARTNQISFDSRHDLVADNRVVDFYQEAVERLNRNLAQFEKLKRVILISEELSAEDGTLTASFKLRRRIVEERYRGQIAEMYQQADAEKS